MIVNKNIIIIIIFTFKLVLSRCLLCDNIHFKSHDFVCSVHDHAGHV